MSVDHDAAPAPSRRRWWVPVLAALVLAAAAVAVVMTRPDAPSNPPLHDGLFLPSRTEGTFMDADHGYLLLGRCPTEVCETWVGATEDGGRSWRAAFVPGLTFPRDVGVTLPRADLIGLDAMHAAIETYETTPFDTPAHRRWYTSDGGRSWSEVPVMPVATVDEIPDGHAYAAFLDTPHTVGVRIIRMDGSSALLANVPQSPYVTSWLSNNLIEAPDGSLWIRAAGDGPGEQALYRTTDRGRSWSNVPWPGQSEVGHGYRFHPGDGATVYLLDEGAFRTWRSNDAGATWSEIAVPFDNKDLDISFYGYSLPDGQLIVVEPMVEGDRASARYWALAPTGRAFTPATDPPTPAPDVPVLSSKPGENRPTPEWGVTGMDGSWTPLPFPCRVQC